MRALITGVLGQDGWYLSEFLHQQGYQVYGTRRGVDDPTRNPPGVDVRYCDITDGGAVSTLIRGLQPDEVYNLAALTHVGDSFVSSAAYFAVNAAGAANVMEDAMAIGAKFYQASTSELFGDSPAPQNERTPMRPRSPYGCAKLAAYWMVRNARERGAHATNGILFNHESPRRGGGMVTRKVARAVAAIKAGKQTALVLGNLDAQRDWGHARDYVRGMWMLMQAPADDYVLATGETRTVRELCRVAFGCVGLDWERYVISDDSCRRPLEVEQLRGDASKAHALGWRPRISFEQMIVEMVEAECATHN